MTDAAGSLGVTRRLLRRLRDVMAGTGTGQQRLDQIVRIIATEMVAEVCSAYVMRAGEILELFSSEGLRPEAVHRTRLRVGEGLVGVIAATARPLALSDAQSHPDFAYRPETGEEIFHSLLGVPILRGDRVLGVLVVQNRTLRRYTDDEIEVLQTIAMVIAELAASGELVNPLEFARSQAGTLLPARLVGIRLNAGLAAGPAVLHEPKIQIRQIVAEDTAAELVRLQQAVAAMREAIDDLVAASRRLGVGEHRDVLETYRMFAADHGWVVRIADAIRSGLAAEAAVQKVHDEIRTHMARSGDLYLQERLVDFEDLANRLQQHLAKSRSPAVAELPPEFVLVARSMGPAELLDYGHGRVAGLVLEEGSPTAHVAIVARAFDIPVVGRVDNATRRTEPGDAVIVDGDRAQVLIRPRDDTYRSAIATVKARARRRAGYQTLHTKPAVTRDGVMIKLLLNAGLMIDMAQLPATGAEGVGLFRTELAFMVRDGFPAVTEQTAFYRDVYKRSGGLPIVFRTLDIGGDKALPYAPHSAEDNPAMGWRAIRVGLDRPAMLRHQLRAMVRAAAGYHLLVKFPMIAEVTEFDRANAILEMELEYAAQTGHLPPVSVKTGVMLEIPSLLWQLSALCERVDFLSIGTNDLVQFVFASDRSNPRIADRFDPLSLPMFALFRNVIAETSAAGVPLSMCGEMAGNPLEAMTLIALGFRTLSMAASAIGPVKAMIRSLDVARTAAYIEEIADRPDHSLRSKLEAYARDHAVAL
jgi:phosphotransferase system, enzyme I, PtsP